jgi:hypothetical protein
MQGRQKNDGRLSWTCRRLTRPDTITPLPEDRHIEEEVKGHPHGFF